MSKKLVISIKAYIYQLIIYFMIADSSYAIDASKTITSERSYGDWGVYEFSGPKSLLYRAASISISSKDATLTIDFLPVRNCEPGEIIMVKELSSPVTESGEFILPMDIKLPGKSVLHLPVQISGKKEDKWMFLRFPMSYEELSSVDQSGRVSISSTPDSDGFVLMSKYYFGLNGFKRAISEAKKSCRLAQ